MAPYLIVLSRHTNQTLWPHSFLRNSKGYLLSNEVKGLIDMHSKQYHIRRDL